MSPTSVTSLRATRAGVTATADWPSGCPKTVPLSPLIAEARGRDGSPRPGTASTARSRTGSNAWTWAARVTPSGRCTTGLASPATTWALVTMVSGAGENPLPETRKPQPTPLTRTVEAITRAAGPEGAAEETGAGGTESNRASRPAMVARASEEGAAAGRMRSEDVVAGPVGAACAAPALASGNVRASERTTPRTAGRRWRRGRESNVVPPRAPGRRTDRCS